MALVNVDTSVGGFASGIGTAGHRYSEPWLIIDSSAVVYSSPKSSNQQTQQRLDSEYTHKYQRKFSHSDYKEAGELFDKFRGKSLHAHITQEEEKKNACDLTYETLKYKDVLEMTLDQCAFFYRFPELQKDSGTILCMLFDYQRHHFLPRHPTPGEHVDPFLLQMEQAIMSMRTKLDAILARMRIIHDAHSMTSLLPEPVRKRSFHVPSLPVHVWVNLYKTSLGAAVQALCESGFGSVTKDRPQEVGGFRLDKDCSDVIQFHSSQQETLQRHYLVQDSCLVLQAKSSCLSPYLIYMLLTAGDANHLDPFLEGKSPNLQKLLKIGTLNSHTCHLPQFAWKEGETANIIHTHVGSGRTTAHLAGLLATCGRANNVLAFGAGDRKDAIMNFMLKMGVKNAMIFSEEFTDISVRDPRLDRVFAILVTPDNSNTAILDPVEFICREGGDLEVLKYLSGYDPEECARKLSQLVGRQQASLGHALSFPRVRVVLYQTHSIQEEENEAVVDKMIKQANEQCPKSTFEIQPVKVFPSLQVTESSGPYLSYKPSEDMDGFFLTLITKKEDMIIRVQEASSEQFEASDLSEKLQERSHHIQQHSLHKKRNNKHDHHSLTTAYLSNKLSKSKNGVHLSPKKTMGDREKCSRVKSISVNLSHDIHTAAVTQVIQRTEDQSSHIKTGRNAKKNGSVTNRKDLTMPIKQTAGKPTTQISETNKEHCTNASINQASDTSGKETSHSDNRSRRIKSLGHNAAPGNSALTQYANRNSIPLHIPMVRMNIPNLHQTRINIPFQKSYPKQQIWIP